LEDGVRIIAEVGRSQAGEGRTEGSESAKDGFTVRNFGADEEIEILGCARLCVDAHRVSADDQVFNSVFVERA
jgi:hypothetical protein